MHIAKDPPLTVVNIHDSPPLAFFAVVENCPGKNFAYTPVVLHSILPQNN